MQLLPQQSRSALKSVHLPVRRAPAFREHQDMKAAVHGSGGVCEARAKISGLRQREYVEQRCHQVIGSRSKQIEKPVALAACVAPIKQHLAGHRHRDSPPHSSAQSVQQSRDVIQCDVIGDNQ